MAITLSSDIAYSYRRAGVTLALRNPDDTTATLGRIDQLLASAADAYRQRRFDDAVTAYQGARNLLWQQLFPLRTFDKALAGRLDLFRTLVSYGAEWMNVLPVEQAASGVRPKEEVALADAPVLGLLSASTGTTGTAAAADLALADELDSQGNSESADGVFAAQLCRVRDGPATAELSCADGGLSATGWSAGMTCVTRPEVASHCQPGAPSLPGCGPVS